MHIVMESVASNKKVNYCQWTRHQMANLKAGLLWLYISTFLVLSTDLFPFGRTKTTDLIQVLDEYTNLDLQEGIPDILNFMLWEWKKCLLYQESCMDTTRQGKKCNPDLLVLAMKICVSEKEKCDSFALCSSAKEEKLDCPTDESTLGQHLCHNFTDCHRCFTCCQSSASSEKICLPRMDFQINWRALQKQENEMTSIRGISRCHGVQSNLYWISPKGSSYDSETEDHFNVQSLVLGNETSFNFTVLAVDNRIAIWTYNTELYKNSFSTREMKIMPSIILSSTVQLRAIPRMSTDYGLARMIVLDNCNQLHVVGQLIIPISFQPRLESRVAVVEVEEYSEIKLCLKKYLYTNLLEYRKFSSLGISNFEKTISDTHAKTLDRFFDVTKTWIEIGCDKQSINFKELPGIIAIGKKKQNRVLKEPLGFVGVQRLRFSGVLYFTPKLHYAGNFQLPFCLKYSNPFGNSVTIDTTLLQINVTRVSNAPTLLKPPSLQDLPALTLGNQDPGRPSVEYTGPVFGDFGQTSMGMVVIHAQTSEFGQWEVRTPRTEKWNPILTGEFFTPNNYKMGFISGEKFCTLHDFTMESYKPVLLNATDKLMFHSSANMPWWNTTQAKQNTLLIFSVWNMSDTLIPYGWPCFGQSSVSADLFMFSLEYRDCSGQNVVDKPLTDDACGVCNGDNISCQNVVCSGVNSCDVCGTKFSGISIQRDCAGTCEQENALLTFGDHEVCVRRGEEQTIRLCNNSRNTTDLINGCEQCVGKVTGDDIDLCGICGGRNECVSCDGIPFSEFSIDKCGKCLKNGDPQRNYCTIMELQTYSMISTSSRKITIIIKSPEDVHNMTLKCEVFDKENNSYTEYVSMKMHSSYQHDSGAWMFIYRQIITVKDHLLNYIFFLVSCEVSINLTTGIHRLTAQKLFMWNLEMFMIKKITPSTINIEENVKVTVELQNKTTSGLWCFYGAAEEMSTLSKAIILGPYSVQCDISATSTRNLYQLMIIPESKIVNNSTRISAYLNNIKAYIRPNTPAPLAIEAVITEELTEIRITFDINLYKRDKTCRDSFTSATLQQLGVNVPSCRMFGNFIFISLPSAFKYTSNMTVEFAETNFQYNPRGVVHVTLPHKTVKPILHVQGPEKVCSGMLQIHVSETVGGGVFGLNYKWSISSNHKVNLSTIFDILESTTSFLEIPAEKLEPELTYVFSVYGENIIGVKSDTYFHSVMRINDQRIIVTIIGPDEVSIWAENKLVAEVTWCSNVSHIHSLTYYWRVNSSDFHLPQEWGPVLRISKFMKGQTTYKFMVTVIDVISLEVLSQATHIVRTKEVPLVVRTGVLSLVVPYNQTFCLNGSGSYDPSKEKEPMYYRWMCSLTNGLACYIRREGSMLRLEQTLRDIFSSVLCIDGGVLLPQEYNFTLVIKKGTRTGAASVPVKVVGDKNVPFLAFDDITIRGVQLDPARDFHVNFLIDPRIPYVKISCTRKLGFQCTSTFTTYITRTSVKIMHQHLSPFNKYIFSIYNKDFMSPDTWPAITFTTAGPPEAGHLKVFQTADCTVTCEVTLDASGWKAHIDRYPLSYQFAYSQSFVWKMNLETSSKAIVRNVKLPCGKSKITVTVCDAFAFCSEGHQIVYLPCSVPETPVLLTTVKKLLHSGYHQSAWSLLNPIKMTFSARMIDKITSSIEESILLILEQYRLGLQEIPHLKIPALDELVTVLEVLFMTHKSNNMKVELVNFKDEIIKTLMHQPLENQDNQIETNIYSDTVHRVSPISEIQAKAMIQVLEYHMELNLEDNFDIKKGRSSKQVIHDINVINMGVCHSLYVNKGPLEATFPNLNVYVHRKEFHNPVHSIVAEVSFPSLLNPARHVSIQLHSFFSSAENAYVGDICLSLVQYPTEYFQSFSLRPHKMLTSEVLEVKFLCPQDDCTLQFNRLYLTITLPVIDGYSGYMCLKWTNSGWMENYCETKEIIEAQHFFKCRCFTPGFYGVSAFASNISESVTDQTLQTLFVNDSESVAVIIGLEDVKGINLKEQKARFLIHLRDQLAVNLGIQTSQIERIVLEEDELLLKFIVLPGFNSSTASLTYVVRTLYHMVNNEVLNLTDLAEERVRVIPYTLSLSNSLHLVSNDILGNTVDADLEQKASGLSIIQILIIISAVISVMLVTSLVVLKYRRKKLIKVVPETSRIDVSSYSANRWEK